MVSTEADPILRLHVYNFAGVSSATLQHTLEETSCVLADAGLHAMWEPGVADLLEGHSVEMTATSIGARRRLDDRCYLVVRFEKGLPPTARPGVLGFAVPAATYGVHVSIFYDRIEKIAPWLLIPLHRILGNVLAHEIGHVLLGSSEHSERGIMKAVWTKADYQRLAERFLEFLPREALAMRNEVSRRTMLSAAPPP
jgi:hypothetical protein